MGIFAIKYCTISEKHSYFLSYLKSPAISIPQLSHSHSHHFSRSHSHHFSRSHLHHFSRSHLHHFSRSHPNNIHRLRHLAKQNLDPFLGMGATVRLPALSVKHPRRIYSSAPSPRIPSRPRPRQSPDRCIPSHRCCCHISGTHRS